jgi:hypothetical protein
MCAWGMEVMPPMDARSINIITDKYKLPPHRGAKEGGGHAMGLVGGGY